MSGYLMLKTYTQPHHLRLQRSCLEALTKTLPGESQHRENEISTFQQQRAPQGRRPTAPPPVLAPPSLDFRLAHKLYARTPLQKSPLWFTARFCKHASGHWKNKIKYTTQTVKGSDLVCRFWCPISTFADVSVVMAFYRENVFSGVGEEGFECLISFSVPQNGPLEK